MEQLLSELSLVLGEHLSRLERISEQPYASLYFLYDREGHSMPLVAKYFTVKGMAAQEAGKLSVLAQESSVHVPRVWGLVTSQRPPQHEVLLIERMEGVSVEAPARSPVRWHQLQDQIVDALLTWHRVESNGLVGSVDSTQENTWPTWYAQRVSVLWSTLGFMQPKMLSQQDYAVLNRSRKGLAGLMADFRDPCVLVHGNLRLRSLIKGRDDRLLSICDPGRLLWAPREYDLTRLFEEGPAESLLYHYLQRAPVDEGFIARRWLYLMWDQIDSLMHFGQFDRATFDRAARSLLPWLS